jgi:hypothetical protein
MQEFKIEHGIPYKKGYVKKTESPELPLDQMKEGDSILLEKKVDKEKEKSLYAKWYNKIKGEMKKRRIRGRFTIGRSDSSLRVWRLSSASEE